MFRIEEQSPELLHVQVFQLRHHVVPNRDCILQDRLLLRSRLTEPLAELAGSNYSDGPVLADTTVAHQFLDSLLGQFTQKVAKTMVFQEAFVTLYQRALEESRDHQVLIEQFIEGLEFSVEVIVWQGEPHVLAVTDKKTTEAPYFVELGHNQPSVYSEGIQQKLKDGAI